MSGIRGNYESTIVWLLKKASVHELRGILCYTSAYLGQAVELPRMSGQYEVAYTGRQGAGRGEVRA